MHGLLEAILGSNKSAFFFWPPCRSAAVGRKTWYYYSFNWPATHPTSFLQPRCPMTLKSTCTPYSILFAFIYFSYLGVCDDTKEFEAVHFQPVDRIPLISCGRKIGFCWLRLLISRTRRISAVTGPLFTHIAENVARTAGDDGSINLT